MVTLFAKGEILGMGMNQDAFMIAMPVAVSLGSFAGAFEEEAAVLRWSTILEQNVGGFNVLRSERETDGFERVTGEPIPSRGSVEGASYEFKDASVSLNRTYYYKLEEVSGQRAREISGPYPVVCRAPFALDQNVPNPFNPTTTIRFTIATDTYATLAVYDIAGRRVKTLVDGNVKADFYHVVWDGRNESGHRVASGIYFYRLQAGPFVRSHKMIVLR